MVSKKRINGVSSFFGEKKELTPFSVRGKKELTPFSVPQMRIVQARQGRLTVEN